MATYRELRAAGESTRAAAGLVGVSRAIATRKPRTPMTKAASASVPVNKLSLGERAKILEVVNSPRFVDLAPIQIYAQLLDEGTYLCSISTIYRILAENSQVKERRRLARHPARAVPELVATGPSQVYTWDITKLAGPGWAAPPSTATPPSAPSSRNTATAPPPAEPSPGSQTRSPP